jgi:hypothetical protein
MAPTPLNFNSIQPFKAVRDNWSSIKPYHDNYLSTISLATVLTAFLGTVSLIVKHGFKFPRLHPIMEVEELQPSREHPNEFVTLKDLTEAKVFEFKVEQWKKMAQEAEERRLEEARRLSQEQKQKGNKIIQEETEGG